MPSEEEEAMPESFAWVGEEPPENSLISRIWPAHLAC